MSRIVKIDFGQELNRIESEMRKHRDAADQIVARVVSENRDFSVDEKKGLEEAQTNIVNLRTRQKTVADYIESTKGLDDEGESRTAPKPKSKPSTPRVEVEENSEDVEYREAFTQMVRFGFDRIGSDARSILSRRFSRFDMNDSEQRDLSSFSGTDGGYLVPQGLAAAVDVATKLTAGMLSAPTAQVRTSKGDDIPYPTVNDTSNEGELIGENTSTTVTTTSSGQPSIGQVIMKSYTASSKLVKVPNALLQDSLVSIDTLMGELFGERIGRTMNRYLTLGNNASQPRGIANSATQGKRAASTSTIAYTEIVDLVFSVDATYRDRPSAGFQMNDSTIGILSKLLATDGRPIWMPAAVAGMAAASAQGTIFNKPYWANQHMDAVGSGKKSVFFGAWETYKVRRIGSPVMIRLSERYAESFQTAFCWFERFDGRSVDASGGAIKYIDHA